MGPLKVCATRPLAPSLRYGMGAMAPRNIIFNGLGQTEVEVQPPTEEPAMMKFKSKGGAVRDPEPPIPRTLFRTPPFLEAISWCRQNLDGYRKVQEYSRQFQAENLLL